MRRQAGFIDLRCNRGSDHRGTVPVSCVVLYNQHRPNAALFAANNWTEVGVIYIAPFYVRIQKASHSAGRKVSLSPRIPSGFRGSPGSEKRGYYHSPTQERNLYRPAARKFPAAASLSHCMRLSVERCHSSIQSLRPTTFPSLQDRRGTRFDTAQTSS